MHDEELQRLLASLHSSLKLQSALLAKFEQREVSLQTSIDQHMRTLQDRVTRVGHQIETIVSSATSKVADDAQKTFAPIAASFNRDASARLHAISRTLSLWCGAAVLIVVLTLLCGWTVLSHYRHELAATREELQRHEDAIPVLQAYAASDATVCGGRICVNIEAETARLSDKHKYRRARPRPAR